jgi:aminoglycoside 3-N-acetyltransferase I
MNVEIYQLGQHDTRSFTKLLTLFAEVFEMERFAPPTEEHLEYVLSKENFLAFTASVSDQIVGGVTCYILDQYYNTSSYIYIFDLAVHPQYQRMGFGRRLLQAVIERGKSLGAEEVFVQADDVDIHALEFYRASGGLAEKVTHFTYSLTR